ncbi:MAG: hypothetical protein Q4F34_09320 [Prevotellaceae bacterium]|nr:hypothetical protein [Prevotellaceae bacterium]
MKKLVFTLFLMCCSLIAMADVQHFSWKGNLGDNISFQLDLQVNNVGAVAGETTYFRKNGKIAKIPVYGVQIRYENESSSALLVNEYDGNKQCGTFFISVDNNGNFMKGNWSLVDKELNMKNIVELEPDFGKRFFHPTNNIKDAVGKYSFTYQTGNPNMPECGGHCYLVAEKGKLHWMMGQVTPNIAEGEGMASFVDSGFKGSYQNFSFEAYVDEYFVYVWRTNPDEGQVDDWGAWATLEGVYVRELEESGFDGSVN